MQIRDRILDFRRVRADQLRPNPRNWRTHPVAQQEAMRGMLAEIHVGNKNDFLIFIYSLNNLYRIR